MEARKGLGTVCRCFQGLAQPPIGLQPPGPSFKWPDAKRETPQFARRVASGRTLVGTPSPSNPNPTAHRRRVQKSTKQRHPVCCIIQRSPECKDPGSCTTWRSTRNNQHLDAQI